MNRKSKLLKQSCLFIVPEMCWGKDFFAKQDMSINIYGSSATRLFKGILVVWHHVEEKEPFKIKPVLSSTKYEKLKTKCGWENDLILFILTVTYFFVRMSIQWYKLVEKFTLTIALR